MSPSANGSRGIACRRRAPPRLASVAKAEGDALHIAARLQRLSAELGTAVEADAAGVLRWRAPSHEAAANTWDDRQES